MAMNLGVQRKASNFLTSSAISSFSRCPKELILQNKCPKYRNILKQRRPEREDDRSFHPNKNDLRLDDRSVTVS
jgi:hypothetical protein